MSKFVLGDLVTLSAAGRKNNHNKEVYGKIGIVINVRSLHCDHPYQIKWIGSENTLPTSAKGLLPMAEYEIKFVKNGVVPCE